MGGWHPPTPPPFPCTLEVQSVYQSALQLSTIVKSKYPSQSRQLQITQRTNQNSKQIHETVIKRRRPIKGN